jgi:hypothetical protein
MQYVPAPLPVKIDDLPKYLNDELRRISNETLALSAIDDAIVVDEYGNVIIKKPTIVADNLTTAGNLAVYGSSTFAGTSEFNEIATHYSGLAIGTPDGNRSTLQCSNAGYADAGAFMTFHRSGTGAHAAYFGLDTDNVLKIGGWSKGSNAYKIHHEGIRCPITAAGGTATGDGQIYLNGDTLNRIDYNVNGLGAPSMAGRSQGTKINLRPGAFGGTSTDYAIGINSSTFWFSTSSTSADYKFYGGATLAATVTGDGQLTIVGATATKASGTTWANPSDRRLKENIRDYTRGLAELNQLKIHEWEYNGYGNTTKGLKGMGVIADEIITVLPETVGTYLETLPNEVEPIEFKKVDSSEVTWLLVKAVQDLSAQVDLLKQELASLKNG